MFALPFLVLLLVVPQTAPEVAPSDQPTPASPEGGRPVGGVIKEPRRLKHVDPAWPRRALQAGLDGVVTLECVIDPEGVVKSTKLLSGYSILATEAAKAVTQWRYVPTLLGGKAVPVTMTITVNFKLSDPPARSGLPGAAKDADPEVRWAAVRWLGRYRPVDGKQKKVLTAALEDPSATVRQAAAEGLARIAEEQTADKRR